MRLVTVAEMRALEREAFAHGVTEPQLMQIAGRAVARAAAEWLVKVEGCSVLVLAGPGNNGGDALIAARVLRQEYGAQPWIYLAFTRPADDPLLSWAREAGIPLMVHAPGEGSRLREWLQAADVVLDGLLGIGSRLPVEGAIAEVLQLCRQLTPRGQRRIAVDVPTGVQADTGQTDGNAFRAHLTLATGPAKPGHFIHPGAEYTGRVRALDIGLPAALRESLAAPPEAPIRRVDAVQVAALLPARPDDSHKGTYGKALVIAGSSRYIGAAYLAAAAAVQVGAGLVTLAIPSAAQAALAGRSVETTFLPLPEDPAATGCLTPGHLGPLLAAAKEYDAVAVGPGLGSDAATQRLVLLLAEHLSTDSTAPPLLVDADGLNALAGVPGWPHPADARWVLTPHPGEMSRLSGLSAAAVQADRLSAAQSRAQSWGQVVVLKGAPSIIAAPNMATHLNAFANAALATAGAGDVLTGVITGLLAQGCAPYDAALAGSYLHALAAELWRAEHGAAGLAASQLVEYIPLAHRHVQLLRGYTHPHL